MGMYDWIDPFEEIEKAQADAVRREAEGERRGEERVLRYIERAHGHRFTRWLERHLMRLTRNMVRRAIPSKLRAEMEGAMMQHALAERMARQALAFGTATFRMRFEDGKLEPEVVIDHYDPLKEKLDEIARVTMTAPFAQEMLKRHAPPT